MTENTNDKKSIIKELTQPFVDFANAPKALWGIYVPYILEGLAYFGVLTILGKFLSENVAMQDQNASLVYSFVTGGITLSMLFLGGFTDKIGIRKSLLISLIALTLGRTIISLSDSVGLSNGLWSPMFWLTIFGLLFVIIAYGFYQPAAYAGVKRYSTPKTAAMGFAIIYSFMNLGAFFSGFVASFARQSSIDIFPPNGLGGVFWSFSIITFLALILTSYILTSKNDKKAYELAQAELAKEGKEDKEDEKSDILTEADSKSTSILISLSIGFTALILFFVNFFGYSNFSYEVAGLFGIESLNVYNTLMLSIFGAFLIYSGIIFLKDNPEHPFRDSRFVYFIFILIPVQTLFAHNWLTIPYYLDRTLEGTFVGDYWEVFSNLNPILIFVITPIIAALTIKKDVYKMMISGTFVMALPTFLLAVGPNPYLFIIYVVLMSIGEAMWQPRFLQWVAEIAPKGKTGAYMGIGQFPWFLTKVLTGFYSGYFVQNYLPQSGSGIESRSGEMWLIYSFIALLSPFGLILARKWMQKGFKVKHAG